MIHHNYSSMVNYIYYIYIYICIIKTYIWRKDFTITWDVNLA
jgi:hypothetical protein